MKHKHHFPQILFPRTVAQALEMFESEPDAIYHAGGTEIARSSSDRDEMDFPRTVIALSQIEELKRALRSEHSLEIGAMMTLDRLAAIGRQILPPGLPAAIAGIGAQPLRCRATIGGQIIPNTPIGDLHPMLQIIDTSVEIRFLTARRKRRKPASVSRRIPLAQLAEEFQQRRGLLITRLSIPTGMWDAGYAVKIHPDSQDNRVFLFATVARMEKGILSAWRLVFSDGRGSVLRAKEIEVSLTGRPLPMTHKDLLLMEDAVRQLVSGRVDRHYERDVAVSLTRDFLSKLPG